MILQLVWVNIRVSQSFYTVTGGLSVLCWAKGCLLFARVLGHINVIFFLSWVVLTEVRTVICSFWVSRVMYVVHYRKGKINSVGHGL